MDKLSKIYYRLCNDVKFSLRLKKLTIKGVIKGLYVKFLGITNKTEIIYILYNSNDDALLFSRSKFTLIKYIIKYQITGYIKEKTYTKAGIVGLKSLLKELRII